MLTGDGVDIGQSFPFEVNPLYVKNQEALDTPRKCNIVPSFRVSAERVRAGGSH